MNVPSTPAPDLSYRNELKRRYANLQSRFAHATAVSHPVPSAPADTRHRCTTTSCSSWGRSRRRRTPWGMKSSTTVPALRLSRTSDSSSQPRDRPDPRLRLRASRTGSRGLLLRIRGWGGASNPSRGISGEGYGEDSPNRGQDQNSTTRLPDSLMISS